VVWAAQPSVSFCLGKNYLRLALAADCRVDS
jgi:hypothetical protein